MILMHGFKMEKMQKKPFCRKINRVVNIGIFQHINNGITATNKDLVLQS